MRARVIVSGALGVRAAETARAIAGDPRFEVVLASGPDEARAMMARGADILVLECDAMAPLPVELLEAASESEPPIGAIVIGPHGLPDQYVRAMENGALRFLARPIRSGELLAEIRWALEGSETSGRREA